MKKLIYCLLIAIITLPAIAQQTTNTENQEGLTPYIQGYYASDTYQGSDTAWINANRRFQKYNTVMKTTEFTQVNWVNDTWLNENKTIFTYENDTLLVAVLNHSWGEDGQWHPSSRSEMTYDENNRIINNKNFVKFDTTWYLTNYTENQYDSAGRLIETFIIATSLNSTDTTKKTQAYDIDGNLVEVIDFKYRNGNWVSSDANYLTYSMGKLIKNESVYWYAGELYHDKFDTLIYNAQDQLIERIIKKSYDEEYEFDKKFQYYYDVNGYNINTIYSTWVGVKWVPFTKTILEFDEDGKTTKKQNQKYREEEWVDELKTTLTYNENDKLIDYEGYFLIAGTWTRNGKVTYDYTPSSVIEKVSNLENAMNYPNPFNNTTTIKFELKSSANIYMQVLSVNGQVLADKNLGYLTEGNNEVNIDFSDLPSGSYLYLINNGAEVITNTFTVIK